MLNRYALPSRCPRIIYPSLRQRPTLIPSQPNPRRSVAALAARDRVYLRLYRQRGRTASLRARIGSVKTLNEPKQEQRQCLLPSRSTLVSNSRSTTSRHHVWKSRRSRVSPERPLTVRPRQQGRRARAQSRLQGHVREKVVRSAFEWQPSQRGSGRRGGGDWLRRLYQIVKPSRPTGPHKKIERAHWVSISPWPKDTKWNSQLSVTDSLEKLDLDWHSNFLTLKIPEEMQNWTSLATEQVIRHYWRLRSRQNHANEAWMELGGYDAEMLWRNVMLWCLKKRKKLALMLLLATLKGGRYRPPRYMIADCLNFLARHFLFRVSNPNPSAIDAIWLLTCRFIDGASDQDRTFPVPQHLVYLIIQHSDDLRVLSFYGLLSSNKAVLHVNTMLHFLDRFLDMGRINLSMKLLDTIVSTGFDISSDRVQMACVKLLRARFDTQEEYTVRSNILTQILEMGVRPKIPMFNAILLNAGEAGDFANAWQMYGLAKENALIPDSITHGVLLKGAILSGKTFNLDMVIREIQTNGEVLQNLRLISDVLHAVSLMSPGDEFGAMLDFYKQHCDLRPLQELSMCGDETQASPDANCKGVWPTTYILSQMILAYVRLHQGSLGLIHNYNLYYQCVKEKHPLIAPLAQNDFVANAFILAFGKKLGTLQHCPTVVKHMIELSSPDSATIESVQYAVPTVQTWSILVAAYFRNGQRRAAEKVLDMMRERSIQRDLVTWNTLVSGYAGHLQDASAAVDTVRKMKAASFDVDTYTAKGLGKLRARDKLRKALETLIEEPSVDRSIIQGLVPPLDPAEQHEANMALEWESTISDRRKEVEKYLKAKDQDQLETEMEKPSDSLVATA